jgi:Arylsulfotransferase (ASST)
MPTLTAPHLAARTGRWRTATATLIALVTGVLALAGSATALADPTAPPPISILTSQPNFGHGQDFFITPTGDATTYAQGPEILDTHGNVVWFHAAPAGLAATDFRTQKLWGQNVLTFWQGTENGGVGNGTDYIYNDHYQQIATVNAGNGLQADAHEFFITPWNTALITAYEPATADLSSIGGPSDQKVVDGVVQEIDISTGKVLWQWNSADHVPYSASEQPLPPSASTTWDWFHINAIHLNTDGNFLIDARNTWATYDVSPHSGNVQWTLGGKDSSFALQAAPGQTLDNVNEAFTWQHDPEALGNGYYSIFDDESTIGAPDFGYSRAEVLHLDPWRKTATIVASDNQPHDALASSQGNAQPIAGGLGGFVVGWGNLPYFSAFDGHGNVAFDAQFPTGVNTYRAYLLPWNPPSSGGHGPGGPGGPGHWPWPHSQH